MQVPPGSQLAVHTVVQLIAGLAEHREKLAILAEDQGRKLVTAVAGRADTRDFEAAAVVAVEALRAAFPEVRVAEADGDHVVVEGLEVGLKLIGEVDGQVGDALATGFLRGALAAAGAPASVTARNGRVEAQLDEAGLGAQPSAVSRRRQPRRDLPPRRRRRHEGHRAAAARRPPRGPHRRRGRPAAYARWADRAGHQLVDVARVRDLKGRPAVRLLLRKATGPIWSGP
jgi:hypothetical protein